jgi:hypothetical protein
MSTEIRHDFKYAINTKQGRIERTIAILQDPNGTVNQKMAFLVSKGMSSEEITEALNTAGNGALLEAPGV